MAGTAATAGARRFYPNGRCRFHGGPSKRGVEHGRFKHGHYSGALKEARLRDRFEQLFSDPKLLDLREAIALDELRTMTLLERLGSGDLPNLAAAVRDAVIAFRAATAAKNLPKMIGAIDEIERLSGSDDEAAIWAEIREVTEHRRRLVDTATKNERRPEMIVPVSQVWVFVRRYNAVVAECVHDPAERAEIANRLRGLIGRGQTLDAVG